MNLNDVVRVRLTNAGLRRAAEWGHGLGLKPGTEMSGGEKRGEWQLWRLMQVFGDAMYNGMPEPMFEKNELTVPGLNELRDRVHALAKAKGWYDGIESPPGPRTLGAWLCNIHGEISEALEDVRGGRLELAFRDVTDGEVLTRAQRDEAIERDEEPASKFKPIGLPSELADALIRILDTCGALGIDIDEAVRVKHAYNETRSHRHGNKAL